METQSHCRFEEPASKVSSSTWDGAGMGGERRADNGPLQITVKREKKNRNSSAQKGGAANNSLCNSWPPTNHGIPPAGAMQFVSIKKITKKEKEKHKGKPFRHDRQVHPRAGFVGAFPDEDP
jgi:hypothetical protein